MEEVGDKVAQTDGLAMDSRGRLFLQVPRLLHHLQELTNNAVSVWDTREAWSPVRLVQDNTSLVWVDSMAVVEDSMAEGEEVWATTRGWPIDSQPRVVRVTLE